MVSNMHYILYFRYINLFIWFFYMNFFTMPTFTEYFQGIRHERYSPVFMVGMFHFHYVSSENVFPSPFWSILKENVQPCASCERYMPLIPKYIWKKNFFSPLQHEPQRNILWQSLNYVRREKRSTFTRLNN